MGNRDCENVKECSCLESLLATYFNKGKKQPLFLKNVRKDEEGYVTECFTKRGASVYGNFVDFCYSLGNSGFMTLGDLKMFVKSLENIGVDDSWTWEGVVETTDMISEGMKIVIHKEYGYCWCVMPDGQEIYGINEDDVRRFAKAYEENKK